MSAPKRLRRSRTPEHLAEAGWHLCELLDNTWVCLHPFSKTTTPLAPSPGRAIVAAELLSGESERLGKWWREEQQMKLFYKVWRLGCLEKQS